MVKQLSGAKREAKKQRLIHQKPRAMAWNKTKREAKDQTQGQTITLSEAISGKAETVPPEGWKRGFKERSEARS